MAADEQRACLAALLRPLVQQLEAAVAPVNGTAGGTKVTLMWCLGLCDASARQSCSFRGVACLKLCGIGANNVLLSRQGGRHRYGAPARLADDVCMGKHALRPDDTVVSNPTNQSNAWH